MLLNPNAPAFVPGSAGPVTKPASTKSHRKGHHNSRAHAQASSPPAYFFVPGTEDFVTEADLEELEACDEWVRLQAQLEQMEQDHIVAMALSLAPKEALEEIERRAGSPPNKPRSKGVRPSNKH